MSQHSDAGEGRSAAPQSQVKHSTTEKWIYEMAQNCLSYNNTQRRHNILKYS